MGMIVRNRRLKMSPGGVITLPVAARKALGMEPRQGSRVAVSVDDGAVVISPAAKSDNSWRVSAKGQMELGGEARELLQTPPTRHYWVEADDRGKRVVLHPFESKDR